MKPATLRLSDSTPLATGTTRLIFEHPDDPSLLVKVHRQSSPPVVGRGLKGLFRTLEDRFVYMTGFMREFRPYVLSRYGEHGNIVNHIAPINGMVDTDLGLGLVVPAYRDSSGNLAPTLKTVIRSGGLDTYRLAKLEQLLNDLETDLVIGDLNMDNIVLAWLPAEGEQFMIIDGLGERTLLPVQRWFPIVSRRKKARFARKVRERLVAS